MGQYSMKPIELRQSQSKNLKYVRNYSFEDLKHSNHNPDDWVKEEALVSKALKSHSDLETLPRARSVNSGHTNTH